MTDTAAQSPPSRPAGRDALSVAWFVGLTLVLLAADLWVKEWSFAHVAGVRVTRLERSAVDQLFWAEYPHEPMVLIPHVLSLRLTTNTGAVFGLGKGSQWLFAAVSIVALVVITRVFYRLPARAFLSHAALAMILSGALGNLYDRVMFHAVRDMFYLFPGVRLPFGWHWPHGVDEVYPWIFNLADAALVVGVILMILVMWRNDRRLKTAGSAPR
ncbi:MAG: signal peptidase II [Planctomycetes bacterium]|nr:signal peptidase II [Planctomycetota bacterium]